MAKYLVLYNSTMSAKEIMANSTNEQKQSSMNAWIAWQQEASKSANFEFGLPLKSADRITPEGVTASDNQTTGYSIMEGDSKEKILELLKSHPHFQVPGASIDALEMIPMPGM